MEDPIDLSVRRKARHSAERKAALGRWMPSYTACAWVVLLVLALAGYVVFGGGGTFRTADLSGGSLQAGGIKECGLIRHTCLVDGDTGWLDGTKWRMQGIDAPEMEDKAECKAEREKATTSLERLMQLMADGYTIKTSGRNDKYGRALVDVVLGDGRNAGGVLIQEGLAQRWPNDGNVWCGL
ncbi:MAG: thermonuclease family protein [Hyphomicrobium sp.]|jgi:hypothetical protein|uniref:thermonuclease family protein n=1 Tax=Hyphomicrobium sp. TaxID=82 RepID=UPI0025BDBD5C|nr:thermonuclease family protein [Hyphomicrobium sp.]MBX9862326.1 thermonuclease family protein [Hyphomicrobium sp.]